MSALGNMETAIRRYLSEHNENKRNSAENSRPNGPDSGELEKSDSPHHSHPTPTEPNQAPTD